MYAGQLHILPTTPEAGEIIADWNLPQDEINHLLRDHEMHTLRGRGPFRLIISPSQPRIPIHATQPSDLSFG